MQTPTPSENENSKNISLSKNKLVLLIVAMVLVLCVCIAAVVVVIHTVRNDNPTEPTTETIDTSALAEAAKNTVAITIGDHQINAVELNYYYMEVVNSFCNSYSYYLSYILDVSKPLNEQYFDEANGITWADYFLTMAEDNMKSTYMLCDMATVAGFQLPESATEQMEQMRTAIEAYASSNNYTDADEYVAAIFGYGAELDSYLAYYEKAMLADAYYSNYAESLEYSDDQLREYEKDKAHQYNTYSYATYYLAASKFLTGGTEDSDGKITYTDEQQAAAITAAGEAANALSGSNCQDLEAFNALILGMDVNAGLDSVSISEKTDVFYDNIDTTFQEWVISADLTYGDVGVFAKVTTTGTGDSAVETTEGYYIVWFGGVNDNDFAMKDVRHLLVLFKNEDGKTYSDGITTFTDEQKATAMTGAQELLDSWLAGDATEESFAALATEKTEDAGSKDNGGLYTNIYPGQMVETFEDWCYDATRAAGDYGIVETVYGYHIMYFVRNTEQTYRDYMVSYDLRSADLSQWHDDLVASAELVEVCLDYCELDMVLYG